MNSIGLLIALPLAFAFFGAWIFIAIRFDCRLRHIYETDKERWQKLGGPVGFFWIPKEKTPFFRSTNSRNALLFDYLSGGLKDRPNQTAQGTPGKVPSPATEAPRRLRVHETDDGPVFQ
jgi:hypothetical protein